MHTWLTSSLLVVGLSTAAAQTASDANLKQLYRLARDAHQHGDVAGEINYRQQYSQATWAAYAANPGSKDEYVRYVVILTNDLPLASLLEGSSRFPEAEKVLRRSLAELSQERMAGDDIKSTANLALAELLSRANSSVEAETICSRWKGRMRQVVPRQDGRYIHSVPAVPIYDTPELEVAIWDVSCGRQEEGLGIIHNQILAHPKMLASYSALANHYTAAGQFQLALEAEKDGIRALKEE